MKASFFRMSTQELKQRNGKLWACLVGMLRFGTDLGSDVKTKKNGQAEDSVRTKREPNNNTKRNPIVAQARHRAGLTALERIAKEANAEHVTTTFAGECIVKSQIDGAIVREPSEQKVKEEKAERIKRPGSTREEAVKRAVMFCANSASSKEATSDGAALGKEPSSEESDKIMKGRSGEGPRKGLDKN